MRCSFATLLWPWKLRAGHDVVDLRLMALFMCGHESQQSGNVVTTEQRMAQNQFAVIKIGVIAKEHLSLLKRDFEIVKKLSR
jgi:hypothetical protein